MDFRIFNDFKEPMHAREKQSRRVQTYTLEVIPALTLHSSRGRSGVVVAVRSRATTVGLIQGWCQNQATDMAETMQTDFYASRIQFADFVFGGLQARIRCTLKDVDIGWMSHWWTTSYGRNTQHCLVTNKRK